MGYLTTFTIYNDGLDEILKKSKSFCVKLYDGAVEGETKSFGHGNHANLVKIQKSRHADDHTIYVHAGNTLCEMNVYSDNTRKLMELHPEFFESLLSEMEHQARKLRNGLNEFKVQQLKKKGNG